MTAAPLTRLVPAPALRTPGIRLRPVRTSESSAALGSAVLTMAAYCLAMALHGMYPFGPRSRAVNDLGNQFVPFHAHLWDLQHGTGSGDLFFNWNSGFGTPFLPDFFAYLCNPFSWLTGLFPRSMVDFPVFLVTLLSAGLAAAAMTAALRCLRPGSPWLRALLSVGYALCAWVVNDASPDPMWMWGLAGLPLLVIAADWCLRGRHFVLGTLLVAVVWAGNFYTGAMATLAAALVLLLRLAVAAAPPRAAARVLLRAAAMTATGVLLAAPVLTVSLAASRAAQPAPAQPYHRAFGPLDYLAQLLPAGRAPFSAPNIAAGMLVLLLVATLPFQRAVARRERAGWYLLAVLVALSFVWQPTVLLWHGLAIPNGSPYRAAYVLSGVLVMAAWVCLAARPGPQALLSGAGLLAVLVLLVHGRAAVQGQTWPATLVGGSFFLACLLLLTRVRGRRHAPWVRRALGAALAAGVLLGSAQAVWSSTVIRDKSPWFTPKATMNAQARTEYRRIQDASAWPAARIDPGGQRFANNDPLLVDAEGGAYYSSYVPAGTARLLQSLGMGWYIQGRHLLSPADPVGRAIMSVAAYVPDRTDALRLTGGGAPLVTVRPALPAAAGGDSVFARQERLLGARVYQVPELRPGPGAAPVADGAQWLVPQARAGEAWTHFTATCTPGSQVYVYTPWLRGWVLGLGQQLTSHAIRPMTSSPLMLLGTAPAGGRLDIAVAGRHGPQEIPRQAVGCLSTTRLAAAVDRLKAAAATSVQVGGHQVSARLPAGSRGFAVITTPAVDGWSCSADGGPAHPPASYDGLMGVPLGAGASRISCGFTPPGLAKGLALSGVGLLVLLGAAARPVWARAQSSRKVKRSSQRLTTASAENR
ncbi:membrane protein YfhO [Actinacidiphila rubida]|uniref:Membrane protein YfhO n=2 Tax=Actinacidiphila rubida TaxID=310780 RepID=A0A1H8F3H2_9ACTN|nr:YfhO family protein [Actinacidiphila rubida]SEN25647.1 membrane protein YfhO [Actinacidiphila rubida]